MMSAPTRSSYRPAMGVLLISSMAGPFGLRWAQLRRMAASSDQADRQASASEPARRRRNALANLFMRVIPEVRRSRAEGARDEEAFQGVELVDQRHAVVAQLAQAGRRRAEQLPQAVDGAGHRARGPQAGAGVAAQQRLVAERAPGLAFGDHLRQRRHVAQAQVQALAGQRMDDVGRVADQRPAGADDLGGAGL